MTPSLVVSSRDRAARVLIALCAASFTASGQDAPPPLAVAATVPDLGGLVQEVGGRDVAVTVFSKPSEDPHFVEAKPGFIKTLSRADLFVQAGLDLEIGWAPPLLNNARNAAVLPGAAGHLDASAFIAPLGVPTGPVDRSMGDVHAAGNPHYLLDPLNGLKVAEAVRDRLIKLRPASREGFERRFREFRGKLGDALVGAELAKKYDFEKLALLAEHGKLSAFLKGRNDEGRLGGWLGLMAPHAGAKTVADHDLWPYFARRFGLRVVGFLEPKPGLQPTTKHLTELIGVMKADGVKLILAAPYYDRRHADVAARSTGARVATMAHGIGSRPGAADYLSTIDSNVRAVAAALKGD
jgi:ABC-type Zn uptake system ZnuABC Zn-binding protein ZnuA